MKQRELKQLIVLALKEQRSIAWSTLESDNPTVVEIHKQAQAQSESFMAVLDAINDNPVMLRTYGTGMIS